MRLADPRPAYCSSCFNSSDGDADNARRFVDFEAVWDGPVMLLPDGTLTLAPGGEPVTNDDLYLCESCVRDACEILGLKPELSARQLREIRRLENENRHWKATVKRMQAELEKQVDTMLEPPARPRGRPPKIPA